MALCSWRFYGISGPSKLLYGIKNYYKLYCGIYHNNEFNRRKTHTTQHYRSVSSEIQRTSSLWSVLFFGSDDCSLQSLKLLWTDFSEGRLVRRLEVVTSLKALKNPVKKFAEEHRLCIHGWPAVVKTGEFDIGVVVSFGHLIPQHVIEAFPLGMLNVHTSLLPRWRGAAPIIYSLMNGDEETGVTIMQIQPHKFDVGNIVRQSKYQISQQDDLPSVTRGLSALGAQLILECLQDLPLCLQRAWPQPEHGVTQAPRVTAAISMVDWQQMSAVQVYNLNRAITGLYRLSTSWHGLNVKLYGATLGHEPRTVEQKPPGSIVFEKHSKLLLVKCCDEQWIGFTKVGVPGKHVMQAVGFYNGYLLKRPQLEWYFTS